MAIHLKAHSAVATAIKTWWITCSHYNCITLSCLDDKVFREFEDWLAILTIHFCSRLCVLKKDHKIGYASKKSILKKLLKKIVFKKKLFKKILTLFRGPDLKQIIVKVKVISSSVDKLDMLTQTSFVQCLNVNPKNGIFFPKSEVDLSLLSSTEVQVSISEQTIW